MKPYIALVFLFLCLACTKEATTSSSLVDYIPRKASVIIKTYDVEKLLSETKNHSLLKQFNTTAYARELKSYSDLLASFSSKQESLIAFTQIGKNDFEISFISTQSPSLFIADSTKYKLDKINITSPPITKVTTQETSFYTVRINDIFIASSSQLLLENSIREQEASYSKDKSFLKAYNTSNSRATASILIKGNEASSFWSAVLPKASHNSFKNAFSWIQADLDLDKNDIKGNGVVLAQDSTQQYLQLFKGTKPQVNKIAQITPLSARGAASLSYDSWELYKNNLANYQKVDPSKFSVEKEDLLSTFNEIGLIIMGDTQAIAATSLDTELTNLALASEQEESSVFRQVSFYKLEDDGFKNASRSVGTSFAKAYQAILPLPTVNFYCKLDEFYVFASSQNTLETIVANYQNKAVMASSEAYQNTASQLSRASSLLLLSNTSKIPFANLITEKEVKKMKAVSLDAYPFAALQLIQDNGFMHLQAVLNKNENPLQDGIVAQIASTKLDEGIMMAPQLIKNHRTKGMDIVLQDQTNQLYLLSNSGKILWKKQLDSPIVGNVQQVDLYRNGRLQLAFNTERTFYILDRNGKEVTPFPIQFKEDITQPLAIFDYEKNRNYRFIITQTDKVTMYDKTAKKVSGFTFSKAANEIIFPPQHIRINDKDYITIAETTGKLHILSRTGKSRIDIEDRINFGDTPLFKEGSNFVTYDINGEKVSITTAGKRITTATEYGSGSQIIHNDKVSACIRENILYINTKKITLPFGSYTTPTIHTVKGKNYISCTNAESNQVYLYTPSGEAVDHFPVYGTTAASVGHLERNKSLGLVTQGDARTVLVYRIN